MGIPIVSEANKNKELLLEIESIVPDTKGHLADISLSSNDSLSRSRRRWRLIKILSKMNPNVDGKSRKLLLYQLICVLLSLILTGIVIYWLTSPMEPKYMTESLSSSSSSSSQLLPSPLTPRINLEEPFLLSSRSSSEPVNLALTAEDSEVVDQSSDQIVRLTDDDNKKANKSVEPVQVLNITSSPVDSGFRVILVSTDSGEGDPQLLSMTLKNMLFHGYTSLPSVPRLPSLPSFPNLPPFSDLPSSLVDNLSFNTFPSFQSAPFIDSFDQFHNSFRTFADNIFNKFSDQDEASLDTNESDTLLPDLKVRSDDDGEADESNMIETSSEESPNLDNINDLVKVLTNLINF